MWLELKQNKAKGGKKEKEKNKKKKRRKQKKLKLGGSFFFFKQSYRTTGKTKENYVALPVEKS